MDDNLICFNDKENPFFSLKNFLIKINFNMSNISEADPNSIDQLCEFIHEFIHYLQSFTTINGLSALLSYLDTIVRITLDIQEEIINGTYNIKTVINSYQKSLKKMQLRLYWSREPRKITEKNTPFYFEKNISNPIHGICTNEVFMYNILDKKCYHISALFLRENMAMMGYFYTHGIGQDAVLDYVGARNLDCKYWLLFSYFLYNYPQIKNTVKFTFYFSELALMDFDTGNFLSKLLSQSKYLLGTSQYTDEDTFFPISYMVFAIIFPIIYPFYLIYNKRLKQQLGNYQKNIAFIFLCWTY